MANWRLEQVRDAQAGPKQCAEPTVERQEAGVGTVGEPAFQSAVEQSPNPSRSQQVALHAKIVDLVIGVQDTHRPVEFEAIDDLRGFRQAHVLGAQVTMSFEDTAAGDPRFAFRRRSRQ